MTKTKQYSRLIDLIRDLKSDEKVANYIKENYDTFEVFNIFSHNKNIFDADINEDLNESNATYTKVDYSYNPNLQWTTVLQFCNKEEKYGVCYDEDDYWSWEYVSTIFSKYFKYHPELPWIMEGNEMIVDINTALQYRYKWDWQLIAKNTPVDVVYKYKKHEIFKFIGYCNDITIQWIKNHPDANIDIKTNWDFDETKVDMDNVNDFQIMTQLSEKTPIEIIAEYSDVSWVYGEVSSNPTLTSEYILSNINKNWSWDTILINKNVSISMLVESDKWNYIKKKFINYHTIRGDIFEIRTLKELNEIFGLKKLKKLLEELGSILPYNVNELKEVGIFDYSIFSRCKGLKINDILNEIKENLDWYALSQNSSFTERDIQYGMEKGIQWDFGGLSSNPNITFDFVWKYRYKEWNWYKLCDNDFVVEYKQRKNEVKRQINEISVGVKVLSDIILEY
jgi:hypothetical protein